MNNIQRCAYSPFLRVHSSKTRRTDSASAVFVVSLNWWRATSLAPPPLKEPSRSCHQDEEGAGALLWIVLLLISLWTPGQHKARAPAPCVWSEPRTLELVAFLWALLSSGLEQASLWIKHLWSATVLPWQKLLVLEYYLPVHLWVYL